MYGFGERLSEENKLQSYKTRHLMSSGLSGSLQNFSVIFLSICSNY